MFTLQTTSVCTKEYKKKHRVHTGNRKRFHGICASIRVHFGSLITFSLGQLDKISVHITNGG